MHAIASIALTLTTIPNAPQAPPARQILDSRWIPDTGFIELSTPGGPRLDVVVRELGGVDAIKQPVLDSLPENARVIDARSAIFLGGEGLSIGLAVEHDGVVTYHLLTTASLRPELAVSKDPDQPPPRGWLFTDPIFTSTGKPYRIAEVFGQGDGVEITFRRGFEDTRQRFKGILDEKIYLHPCIGLRDPLAGGGELFEVSGVTRVAASTGIQPR